MEAELCMNPRCNIEGKSQTLNLLRLTNRLDGVGPDDKDILLYNLSLKNPNKVGAEGNDPGLSEYMSPVVTENFCKILSDIICKEKEHQDKLFIYHGTSPESLLLVLTYSLFFHGLDNNIPKDRYYLRSEYCDIDMPTGIDIDEQIRKCLLSTNISILSNVWTMGESTMRLFVKGKQISNWTLEDLVREFLMEIYKIFNINYDDESTLKKIEEFTLDFLDEIGTLEYIMKCAGFGSLLQIGIDEDVFDDVTKVSTSYSSSVNYDEVPDRFEDDETPSVFLKTLKNTPEKLIPYIKNMQKGLIPKYGKIYNETNFNVRLPQIRLLLKSGIMDSDKVVIYPYGITTDYIYRSYSCEDIEDDEEDMKLVEGLRNSDDKITYITNLLVRYVKNHIDKIKPYFR